MTPTVRDSDMRLPIIALFTAALLTAQPVRADQDTPITRQGSADDEVVLMLEAEDWVETKTATVRVAADLAVESGAFGTARADFVATLSGFAIETTWRIVDFAKLRDDAGFDAFRRDTRDRALRSRVALLRV